MENSRISSCAFELRREIKKSDWMGMDLGRTALLLRERTGDNETRLQSVLASSF